MDNFGKFISKASEIDPLLIDSHYTVIVKDAIENFEHHTTKSIYDNRGSFISTKKFNIVESIIQGITKPNTKAVLSDHSIESIMCHSDSESIAIYEKNEFISTICSLISPFILEKSNIQIFDNKTASLEDIKENFDFVTSKVPLKKGFNYELHFKNVLKLLRENGKAAIVVPENLLFSASKDFVKLRRYLVQENKLKMIFNLPVGTFTRTSIKSSLVVLENNNKEIEIIDTVGWQTNVGKSRGPLFNPNKIVKDLKSGDYQSKSFFKKIKLENIKSKDYILSVNRFSTIGQNIKGVEISEIAKIKRGARRASIDIYNPKRIVKIKDLSNNAEHWKLNIDSIPHDSIGRVTRMIDFSCLLIAKVGKNIKPTYFSFEEEPIYITRNIISLELNKDIVNPEFLINALEKQQVKSQIESITFGQAQVSRRLEDILNIKVDLPSLSEQIGYIEMLNSRNEQLNEKIRESDEKVWNQFKEFGHTIKTPLQEIKSWSKNIQTFIGLHETLKSELNKKFSERYDMPFEKAIQKIKQYSVDISNQLEKADKAFDDPEAYPKKFVSLNELNKIISEYKKNTNYKFNINVQALDIIEMNTRGVEINKDSLSILLNNILDNANEYGFEQKKEGNIVDIAISDFSTNEKEAIMISISNNGKVFEKGYKKKDFIKSGSTTNTEEKSRGHGGNIIDTIIKYFGDKDWELVTNLHEWLFVPKNGSYQNNGVAIIFTLKIVLNK